MRACCENIGCFVFFWLCCYAWFSKLYSAADRATIIFLEGTPTGTGEVERGQLHIQAHGELDRLSHLTARAGKRGVLFPDHGLRKHSNIRIQINFILKNKACQWCQEHTLCSDISCRWCCFAGWGKLCEKYSLNNIGETPVPIGCCVRCSKWPIFWNIYYRWWVWCF